MSTPVLENTVYVIGIAAFGLLVLAWGWPRLLGWSIRGGVETPRAFIHRYTGETLLLLAAVFAVGLNALFVVSNEAWQWTDVEPAVTALAVVAAVIFGYAKLYPPSFLPVYYTVLDLKTGNWIEDRVTELEVPCGQVWPIFILVYNVGIAPWSNYRITVTADDDEFHAYHEHSFYPNSKDWAWRTKELRVHEEIGQVQVPADNTLAVGEPQTIRFLLKVPNAAGRYRVTISMVAEGHLSESKRNLWLSVKDEPASRLFATAKKRTAEAVPGMPPPSPEES